MLFLPFEEFQCFILLVENPLGTELKGKNEGKCNSTFVYFVLNLPIPCCPFFTWNDGWFSV